MRVHVKDNPIRRRDMKRHITMDAVKEIRERRRKAPGGKVTYQMIALACRMSPGYVRNALSGHCRISPAIWTAFTRLCPSKKGRKIGETKIHNGHRA